MTQAEYDFYNQFNILTRTMKDIAESLKQINNKLSASNYQDLNKVLIKLKKQCEKQYSENKDVDVACDICPLQELCYLLFDKNELPKDIEIGAK